MRRWLVNVAKNETILVVAAILALISCFVVPPDDEYTMYIHASTISQLICLMIVVCGFQRIGIFRIIGSRLLQRTSSMRGLVLTLSPWSRSCHSLLRCLSWRAKRIRPYWWPR